MADVVCMANSDSMTSLRRTTQCAKFPVRRRHFSTSLLWTALAFCGFLSVWVPQAAVAQDDPGPAVEQLMARAMNGPEAFGTSVTMLTRMGALDAVNALLERVAGANWSADQVRTAAAEIPPELRLRLAVSPELSEAAKAWIDRTAEILRTQLQSPEGLRQAIDQLDARQVDTHLSAIRTLLAGNQASLVELTNALADTPPQEAVRREDLLGLMLRLDRELTVDGLQRFVLYGKPSQRISALAALLRIDPDRALVPLATAVHAAGPEWEGVARFATEELAQQGFRPPDRRRAIEILRQGLASTMRFALRSDAGDDSRALWVMDPSGRLVLQPADALAARYRAATDAATRLAIVADTDPRSVIRQWNAQLAYRVINDPDWGDPDQVASVLRLLPRPADGLNDADASESLAQQDVRLLWLGAMRVAAEEENDAAMIGNLRVIALQATDQSASWWLAAPMSGGDSDGTSPLVQAVDYPHPTVRSEAATVIAELQPTRPYPGQARVVRRLQQMTGLESQPIGVVLENRPEVAQLWGQVMNQAGFRPEVVSSANRLEQFIATGGDVRLIAVKEQPVDAGTIEVIDRIRRIPMTRDVPIVVYSDPAPLTDPDQPADPDEFADREEFGIGDRDDFEPTDREAFESLSEQEQNEVMATPGRFGVAGGIENIAGIEDLNLLRGNQDINRTTMARRRIDLETIARQRWRDVSRRAGLIRYMPQPRSAQGLFELVRQSDRTWHVPPPSVTDRQRYRRIATESLAVPES